MIILIPFVLILTTVTQFKDGIKGRLADSIETTTQHSGGNVIIDVIGDKEYLYSLNYID